MHRRAIVFVQKYRAARQAKLILEGPGAWEQTYRELRNEDIRGFASGKPKQAPLRRGIWEDGHAPPTAEPGGIFDEASESESDPDLDAQEGVPLGPARKKRKLGTGETRKQLSWIWLTLPLSISTDEDDDILRAEWARSRARVRRASEEVMLVREEMRRVLEFLSWRVAWWEEKKDARSNVDDEMKEGIRAYAIEQAALQHTLKASFKQLYETPLAQVDGVLEALEATESLLDGADDEVDNDESGAEDV